MIKLTKKQTDALKASLIALNEGCITQETKEAYKTISEMLASTNPRNTKAKRKLGYKVVIIQHPLDSTEAIQHDGVRKAAETVGGGHSLISKCLNGDRKTAYGSIWERKIVPLDV